jgi:hypothetical protein
MAGLGGADVRVLIGYSRDLVLVTMLRAKGVEAFTCDLLPADHPWHIQGDIWPVAAQAWDWALFHPMCTYLTVSAAWAFTDGPYHQRVKSGTLVGRRRRDARDMALDNFRRLMGLPYPKAIENPAPSFISSAIRPPDQTVQPYDFGDDASKRTGLWLDRLPLLRPTERVIGRMVNGRERWANQTDAGQNRLSPGPDRWLERSRSYPGIMRAMADQWAAAKGVTP